MGVTPLRQSWRGLVAGAALTQSVAAIAAGIVADGGSATSVSTASGGRQTVNIAAAVAGVSHNTYTEFNVGSLIQSNARTAGNAALLCAVRLYGVQFC